MQIVEILAPTPSTGTDPVTVNLVVGGVRCSRRLRSSTALTVADCNDKNGEFLDKNDDVSNADKDTSTTGIVPHDDPSFDKKDDSIESDEEPEGNNKEDSHQEESHEEEDSGSEDEDNDGSLVEESDEEFEVKTKNRNSRKRKVSCVTSHRVPKNISKEGLRNKIEDMAHDYEEQLQKQENQVSISETKNFKLEANIMKL